MIFLENKGACKSEKPYGKLRGRIKEFYDTQYVFAAAMGMDESTLSGKLKYKAEWTRKEIVKACELLDIPLEEAYVYFFAPEVGKSQQEKSGTMATGQA